ncbi:hypothetical protein NRO40_02245 [Streptomyces changanensis]|uniref:Uncharacterized protein n=1 Tax=Streptomyces changanensis TaxID=2964669 RepID=A0ABY5N3R4_9ACTN|nr:hypothetical protein [Streptomyces changanensis]UUS29770.1 hypothetical protein NRO40_02245 [Streptomyces changanensis]
MGRHRQAGGASGARHTLVRTTTALGVAGALALALQSSPDAPASRARPESPRGPLPGAGGPVVPAGGPDGARTGPGRAGPGGAAGPTLLPALSAEPRRPVGGGWAPVPDAPRPEARTAGRDAAPSTPGPAAERGPEPGPGPHAPGPPPGAPAAPGAPDDGPAPSGDPAPRPSAPAGPVGSLGDLLHDLVPGSGARPDTRTTGAAG